MKNLLVLLSILLSFNLFAEQVGEVVFVKGEANYKLNDSLESDAVIITKKSSIVKIKLTDGSMISVGPNSEFSLNGVDLRPGARNTTFNLIKGQVRALIKKVKPDQEDIQFKTKSVAFGVRGTEILLNSYLINNAPVSDIVLTKGLVRVDLNGLTNEAKTFDLGEGKLFNTEQVKKHGLKSVKTASPEMMNALRSGKFLSPDLAMNTLLPVVSKLPGMGLNKAMTGAMKSDEDATKKVKVTSNIAQLKDFVKSVPKKRKKKKGKFRYVLKNEPWDIRTAVKNYRTNKKLNRCYYFFYKSLPGGGKPERFRRDRDCDEFEYDL